MSAAQQPAGTCSPACEPNSPACFQEIIELILYQYRHFCLLYVHIGSGYNGNFYHVNLYMYRPAAASADDENVKSEIGCQCDKHGLCIN